MKINSVSTLASLAFIAAAGLAANAAQAAAVIQTKSFDFSTPALTSAGGNQAVFNSNYLSAAFNPFNASLGTLNSFTVLWDFSAKTQFDGGPNLSSTASAGSSTGGNFKFATVNYDGAGPGGFASGVANGSGYSFLLTTASLRSFDALLANFSPAILQAVTGTSDFDLRYDTALNVNYVNVKNLVTTVAADVTLTYNYTAAAPAATNVPEPTSLALVLGALLAAGAIHRRRRAK